MVELETGNHSDVVQSESTEQKIVSPFGKLKDDGLSPLARNFLLEHQRLVKKFWGASSHTSKTWTGRQTHHQYSRGLYRTRREEAGDEVIRFHRRIAKTITALEEKEQYGGTTKPLLTLGGHGFFKRRIPPLTKEEEEVLEALRQAKKTIGANWMAEERESSPFKAFPK